MLRSGVTVGRTDPTDRKVVRALLCLSVFFLLGELAIVWFRPFPLFDPDESIFANIALEMTRSGDFLTPRYRGEAFFDRPALYYWLLAGAVKTFGLNDFTIRLPSILLGFGTIVVIGLLARELFGGLVGAASTVVACSVAAHPVLTFGVTHDAALVFFVTASVWAGLRRQNANTVRLRVFYAVFAGVLMGLACLSKGLLGFVLPAFFLVSYALLTGKYGDWRSLLLQTVVAIALGGSWYAAMHLEHSDYLSYFIVERHLKGFLTSSQRHGGRSMLVYLPPMLLGGLPWSLLLIAPVARWFRSGRRFPDRRVAAVIAWLLLTVAFFCCAGSRNPSYLLPAFPPMTILIGLIVAKWSTSSDGDGDSVDRIVRHFPAASVLVFSVAAMVVFCVFRRPTWMVIVAGTIGVAATFSVVLVAYTLRLRRAPTAGGGCRRRFRTLALQQATWLGLIAAAVVGVMPQAAYQRSTIIVVDALREMDLRRVPIAWFNHIPPSASYYGPEFDFERVYYSQIQDSATAPFVLVSRENRLVEVLPSRLVQGARHLHPGGKYHIFLCGEFRSRMVSRPDPALK